MNSAGDGSLARKLGWAWVAAGVIICLFVLITLPATLEVQSGLASPGDSSPSHATWFNWVMALRFQYGVFMSAAHLCFGVFLIIAGVAFSRRRAWSRPALEVALWVALAYTGIQGVAQYLSLRAAMPSMQNAPVWYRSAVTVAEIMCLHPLFLLALVSMIILLRSSTVRQALGGAAKDAGEAYIS